MFYCQIRCGDVNFSIKEWNKAFRYCIDNNLSEELTTKILEGEICKEQCIECACIVGERRLKTKQLSNNH